MSVFIPAQATSSAGNKRVDIKEGWFYVDGEKFFIKGVCYFEAHEVFGRYEQNTPEVLDFEFKRIKEAGFNTIRTYLTPEKIEIAKKYGLMIMQDSDRLCFSDDYKDPAKINEYKANIDKIAGFSKKYDNILFYTIDNEPNVKALYKQGEKSAAEMWRALSDRVKQVDPGAFTSICIMPPDAFADTSMCDVATLNLYPFNPAKDSIGYEAYAGWYRRACAKGRPFIISEYGWTDDLKQLSPEMMKLLDRQVQAGATGSFFFTWRAWGKEKEKDNQWWGLVPNNAMPDDYKAQPRPLYYDMQKYFSAVVVEPKQDGVYTKNLRFEICVSDKTASMTASCGGRKVMLKRQGKSWWTGNFIFGPSSFGSNAVIVESKGRDGKTVVKKEFNVYLCAEKRSLRVKILRNSKSPAKDGVYDAKVIVVDEKGKRVPNQKIILGINQTGRDEWASVTRRGITDSNGEYLFKEEGVAPGYFTLMAYPDSASPGIELFSDVDTVRYDIIPPI
ncbi:MAG: glycoside hydrolase family 2 TIM barrel-domain containing protein [Candidatus Omnitrophica bacterium]|nr:glycoside hydrolase family 2 TIM barrel-domain containing protein [Candidatus Omnitrophota bacterium]